MVRQDESITLYGKYGTYLQLLTFYSLTTKYKNIISLTLLTGARDRLGVRLRFTILLNYDLSQEYLYFAWAFEWYNTDA